MHRRTIAAGGAAFVIAGAVGGGVAYANAGSSAGTLPAHLTTATTSATTKSTTKSSTPKKQRPLVDRVVHGRFTVHAKRGYRTVLIQRGKITADSGNKVTVKSGDNYTYTYTTDSHTRVRLDKQKSSPAKLATGDRVMVLSGTNGTALRISARTK